MTKTNKPKQNGLGDISLLYVLVLLRATEAEGGDTNTLKTQYHLSDSALASPDARISIPRFMRLGHAAITLTGNKALGLRMGALTRPIDAGIAGVAAETGPTIGQALATLIRYALLSSQNSRGESTLSPEQRTARFYSIRPYNRYNCFVVDSILAAWTQMVRHMTGRYDVLEQVRIEYPSIGLDEVFESWFRCPVEFGATENSIRLKASVWEQVPFQAHEGMHEKLTNGCEQELKQLRKGWSVADRARYLMTPLLKGETPTLEALATRLGTTPWTLQRQLASEGTGFRQLLDDTRKQLAQDYLQETGSSLSEIAWLLGFANPPAFHKAYQRWHGVSPGERRKQIQGM
ncbi:AraC family transcriptional regulator [Marinobacter halophilus]|uniref:AraC family transcriptional regulator n=1 Tax=Marinobacter halophilus TaxID=1323740 RepID=A0A2T1K9P8_9GAMM|nr:AraC family transcriptional regulator [Marinobacter halophilus]PSF06854.1 AraC family transcriptional regulator [Marinobacter halophilus]GGC76097.1 transcriptional regulator [Marinobacter halophilus]